jgi:DNA-binding XRE family transcriptional regulator
VFYYNVNVAVVIVIVERGRKVKTIRELRQERGWTQFELALKVGVQPQAVYFWESGRRTPQVPQLRKLGEVFEMCSDDIALETLRSSEQASHRPRADRHPGEPVPGRSPRGQVTSRGQRVSDREET